MLLQLSLFSLLFLCVRLFELITSSFSHLKVMDGDSTVIWDSNRVSDNSSVCATYAGPAVTADTHYAWRVRLWDQDAAASEYRSVAENVTP